jgi:hypothetical protein
MKTDLSPNRLCKVLLNGSYREKCSGYKYGYYVWQVHGNSPHAF